MWPETCPHQVLKNSTEMYSEKDLYVGKVLSVHQRTFELLEADEFTYQYMENNRHVYLMADWEAALKAIQAQLQGIVPVFVMLSCACVGVMWQVGQAGSGTGSAVLHGRSCQGSNPEWKAMWYLWTQWDRMHRQRFTPRHCANVNVVCRRGSC